VPNRAKTVRVAVQNHARAGGDALAVGAERHTQDRAAAHGPGEDLVSAGRVPHRDLAIQVARGKPGAIRAVGHALDAPLEAATAEDLATGGRLPHGQLAGRGEIRARHLDDPRVPPEIAGTGDDPRAVGAEGRSTGGPGVAPVGEQVEVTEPLDVAPLPA